MLHRQRGKANAQQHATVVQEGQPASPEEVPLLEPSQTCAHMWR
jgi:hypothetical protein